MLNKIQLLSEIESIATNEPLQYNTITRTLEIRNGTPNLNITKLIFTSYTIASNFNNTNTDYIEISFIIGNGDYYELFKHNEGMLTAAIITKNDDEIISTDVYKMFISNLEQNNKEIEEYNAKFDTLNQTSLLRIKAQLIPVEYLAVTDIYVNDAYVRSTANNVILSIFNEKLKNIQIAESQLKYSVDMVLPDNSVVYDNLQIEKPIQLLKVPLYFQQHQKFGLYNTGCGVFARRSDVDGEKILNIYVYKLNYNYIDDLDDVLEIYMPDNLNMIHAQSTYKLEKPEKASVLKIIPGSLVDATEVRERNQLSTGNILMTTNMWDLADRSFQMTSDGGLMPSGNMTNIVGTLRADGYQNRNINTIGENPYVQRTMMQQGLMKTYTLQWNFSKHELLRPGMQVKYIYTDQEDKVKTEIGVLQTALTNIDLTTNVSSTAITFMATDIYNAEA